MSSKNILPGDDYKAATAALSAAIDQYNKSPNVQNLVAVYEAQNAVRAVAAQVGTASVQAAPLDAKTVSRTISQLQSSEPVPGLGLGMAQALLDQLRVRASAGPQSMEEARSLADAQRQLEEYIQQSTARIQDDDSQFADEYMRLTGQPPPPGRFSSAQTINGTTPTPAPAPGAGVPDSGITSAPDAGVRPEMLGPQLVNSPAMVPAKPGKGKPPKRELVKNPDRDKGKFNYDPSAGPINIEALPEYAPYDAMRDYETSGAGVDVQPGASDSVKNADVQMQQAIKMSPQAGIFQAGTWMGRNKSALSSGRLVFTGYATRNTKYIDEDNPRFGSQIVATRTPSYQSTAGLTYALGKPGFPNIAEYQKAMGLPVTGTLDDDTMKAWQSTINEAAMNTASGINMTVQTAMVQQIKRAQWLAAQQRAAMAAAYNVDPTASAAVLGSAMKQITGRLSTAGEDSEFHRAFNSANISTQGKVDAQQFARDWVRNKYPTEAGTMAGQDYYGAMFDVLTSGPGSLGSEAADING